MLIFNKVIRVDRVEIRTPCQSNNQNWILMIEELQPLIYVNNIFYLTF